jgi:membrane protease YdiL (CAAX protease family)
MTGNPSPADGRTTESRTAWRILLFVLALAAWLACFVVLVRWGTWTVFAVAGGALVTLSTWTDPALFDLLRPSLAKLGIGLMVGMLMLVLTHAAFALFTTLQPGIKPATLELYDLLNAVGYSSLARAALIVAIAASEEVLFRGVLVDSGLDNLEDWRLRVMNGPRLSRVLVLTIGYAAATLPLGSPLLSACALLCGLAWGGLRVATQSLVPPVAAHIVWDLGVLLVWPVT